MSNSTTLIIFGFIIAASCSWQVYLAVLIDRQTEVIRTSISEVLGWLEAQELVNMEQMEINSEATKRLNVLKAQFPDLEWEEPND